MDWIQGKIKWILCILPFCGICSDTLYLSNDEFQLLEQDQIVELTKSSGHFWVFSITEQDSVLRIEGHYNNKQQKTAQWNFYEPSGLKRVSYSFKNDSLHGAVQFFSQGKIMIDAKYKNGDLREEWTYDVSGQLLRKVKLKDGVLRGKQEEYKDGILKSVKYYKSCYLFKKGTLANLQRSASYTPQGTPKGKWIYYDRNGKVLSTEKYRKGELVKTDYF